MSAIPHRALELLLEGWRDHSKTGFHVTYLVSPDDQEFIKSFPSGTRFSVVMVRLADDDTPAALPTPEDLKKETQKRQATALADAG